MKKGISFKFERGKLNGYLLNGPSTLDLWYVGLLYPLFDTGEESASAQIIVKIHTISITGWKRHAQFPYSGETLINLMDLILPHILIPRTTQEVKNAYLSNKPFTIIFGSNSDKFNPDTYTLEINSCNSIEDLVEKIVYGGEYTNKLVRNEILKYLYNEWEQADEKSIPFEQLYKKMFIPLPFLERNLKLLAQQDKIKRYVNKDESTMSVFLLEKGVSYVDNDFQDINTGNQYIYNMGDTAGGNISKIDNSGNNNQNIINTGTLSIENSFNELREAIENEYTEPDKEVVLKEAEEFEKEAKMTSDKKVFIQKMLTFAGKFAMNPTIMNIITTKIVPIIQEGMKQIKI